LVVIEAMRCILDLMITGKSLSTQGFSLWSQHDNSMELGLDFMWGVGEVQISVARLLEG